MGEIEAGDRTRRMHGKALGQFNIRLGGDVENAKECRFFCMIGLGRITGRGANTGIALCNEVLA